MEIRPALDSDVPAIVALLKTSLGESLMPKSVSFWNWKHIQNPFGKSPVLLAFENSQLIGVRAFMRWEWRDKNRIYRTVRAVDTATHPAHQGKGIFKKLTLQLVDECKKDGVDFIFNTPNKSSKPGYIKMGWQSMGRLQLKIKFHFGGSREVSPGVSDSWGALTDNSLLKSQPFNGRISIQTSLSAAYLKWRYQLNPNVNYQILSSDGERPFVLVYRIKPLNRLTEVRITDLIAANSLSRQWALSQLVAATKRFSVITFSDSNSSDLRDGFIPIPIGPVVTTRNLNLQDWPECLSFEKWSPSLGDLELF